MNSLSHNKVLLLDYASDGNLSQGTLGDRVIAESVPQPDFFLSNRSSDSCTVRIHAPIRKPGCFYVEALLHSAISARLGVCTSEFAPDASRASSIGDDMHSYAFDGSAEGGAIFNGSFDIARDVKKALKWKESHVVGILMDTTDRSLCFTLNGQVVAVFDDIDGDAEYMLAGSFPPNFGYEIVLFNTSTS